MNAAAALAQLAADLEAGRLPPPEARAQFAAGVRRYLESDTSLDAALALDAGAAGRESARTTYRRHQRDGHLRAAAALISAPHQTARAEALAREIHGFESRQWPRLRTRRDPPPDLSELRTHLMRARQCGRLPESPRQLLTIISGATNTRY